jgi:hypothetical protein
MSLTGPVHRDDYLNGTIWAFFNFAFLKRHCSLSDDDMNSALEYLHKQQFLAVEIANVRAAGVRVRLRAKVIEGKK